MNSTLRSQRFQPLLSAGETLRWTGAPPTGLRFRAADAFLVPFSLFWGGFAFVWEGAALTHGGPPLFALWGVPFCLIGLYLIFGRFIFDAFQRAHTAYAVTDRAAYVVVDGPFARTLVFNAQSIMPIELKVREGARAGSIHFGPRAAYGSRGYGWNVWTSDSSGFTGIDDVASVYALVKEIA